MAGKTRRPTLAISAEERERLERLRDSRKAPKREVERAAVLLRYAAGEGPAAIQHALGLSRPTIYTGPSIDFSGNVVEYFCFNLIGFYQRAVEIKRDAANHFTCPVVTTR